MAIESGYTLPPEIKQMIGEITEKNGLCQIEIQDPEERDSVVRFLQKEGISCKETNPGVYFLSLKKPNRFVRYLPAVGKIIATFGKFTKVILAGVSLLLYSAILTWKFSLLIMSMLFLHESGHVWAMRRYGMVVKGIYFVPFFGGAAIHESEIPSRRAEVIIALMGPIWGLGYSLILAALYGLTKQPLFAAAAAWGAVMNIFNLLPINPLDGGRVIKTLTFSIHNWVGKGFLLMGMLLCCVFLYKAGIGIFLFLLFVGALDLLVDTKNDMESLSKLEIVGFFLGYLVLIFCLLKTMLWMVHVPGAEAAMKILKGI